MKEDAVMGTKLKCVFERKDSTTVGSGPGAGIEASNAAVTGSAPSSHEEKTKRIGDSVWISLSSTF